MTSAHCTHCGSEIGAADEYCRLCGHAQRADGEVFFPVSPAKFVLMNLATFGFYTYYWAWRCWRYTVATSSRPVNTFWRTALLPVTAFFLFRQIETTRVRRGQARPEAGGAIALNLLLALLFLLLSAASSLPDPYNIVTVLAFAPFLPALGAVNRLNLRHREHYRRNSRFGVLKGAFVLVMLPVVALFSAETVGVLSTGQVVNASGVLGWEQRMIQKYTGLAFQSDANPCGTGFKLALNPIFRVPGLTAPSSSPGGPVVHTGTGQVEVQQGHGAAAPKGFKRAPGAAPTPAPGADTACPSP